MVLDYGGQTQGKEPFVKYTRLLAVLATRLVSRGLPSLRKPLVPLSQTPQKRGPVVQACGLST